MTVLGVKTSDNRPVPANATIRSPVPVLDPPGRAFRWEADMAAATAVRVSKDILEDRWHGLLEDALDPSELQGQLDGLLYGLIGGVARVDYRNRPTDTPETAEVDRLVDEIQNYIHGLVVARVDEKGLAR
jgi:hypothetical protein